VLVADLFYTFIRPRLKTLEDRADTLSKEVFKLKQELNKMKNIKDEGHKAKIDEAQSMETSGIYFTYTSPALFPLSRTCINIQTERYLKNYQPDYMLLFGIKKWYRWICISNYFPVNMVL